LTSSHKKVAKLLAPTLFGILTNARLRGLDLHRLFVDSVLIGKQRRYPSIRYHAKGKSGRMETDICQVKVIVQERNEERFYRELA
jgi:ribosomal protein L22